MRAFLLALAVGSTRGLATRAAPRMAVGRDAAALGATSLVPVSGGAITGPAVRASSLWSERGALVFVVRRPGWPLCREEALGLSELIKIRGENNPNFIGIIKEVAPTAQAKTDVLLGVAAFEQKFLSGGHVYKDEDRAFYAFLGNRKLIDARSFLGALFRPLGTWRALKRVRDRLKRKKIEGNMVGEGLLLGGVLVIDRDGEVTYAHPEKAGEPADIDAVDAALDALAA